MAHMAGVPCEAVDSIWAHVEPLVHRCLAKVGEYRWGPEHVLDMLRLGTLQLWVCVGDDEATKFYGIVLTKIDQYPLARECNIWMWCGKMARNWRECLGEIEAWAKEMGCSHICAYTRPGAVRITRFNKGLTRIYRGLA